MNLQLNPLHPLFGAEVTGVDLRRVPSDAVLADIEEAMKLAEEAA